MNPIELVTYWHRKFGVALPDSPSFDPGVCALRIALLTEETGELREAIETDNRVETLDALCDMQYVLSGAIASTGVSEYLQSEMMPSLQEENDAPFLVRQMVFQITKLNKDFQRGYPNNVGARFSVMQWILDALIQVTGFDKVFADAFLAVHENNCAKVWRREELFNMGHLDQWTHCHWRQDHYIVRNSIGKIIKPPGHTKVDLGRFIA